MNRLIAIISASVISVFWSTQARAGFIVDFWTLSAACSAAGQNGGVFQNTVLNPFVYSHSVPVNSSMAQGSYQFAWDDLTGTFRVDASVAGEGGSGTPLCAVDGRVQFHTTSKVLLSAEGEWTYHFSGGLRSAGILLTVNNHVTQEQVFVIGDTGQNGPPVNDPNDDTLVATGNILLPAGGTYRMRWIMDTYAFSGSPASISTGNGYALFSLTTIPEPGSAALFVVGTSACWMRRRIR